MKIVQVWWIDAVCDHDETKHGNWSDPPVVQTFGYLVEETPAVIRVAAEQLEDGTYRCVTSIPKAVVTTVEVLTRTTLEEE